MADYTVSKSGLGSNFPLNATEQSWERTEPLVTPEDLETFHLFGLPLVSNIKDPITGRPKVMTPDIIKKFIIRAVGLCEAEIGVDIFPNQYTEKQAFDKAEYDSFGYFKLRHRPVQSIQRLNVTPSNEEAVFTVPNEWIDVGYLHQGQINLIPLTIALKTGTVVPLNSSAGGATFLSIFGHKPWIPSFWEIIYTSGFTDGKIPHVVNELIGAVAAMEILSALAATYARHQSFSLSLDGASQSMSTPGPQLFMQRLKDLGEKRAWLVNKIKKQFGLGMFVSNV